MKKQCIIFFVLLVAVNVANGTDLIPDSDAVFLSIHKTWTFYPDSSVRFDYHHRLKLLSYYAINRQYGDDLVMYNPEYQKLTIDKSTTTTPNGKVIASPENAFNQLLPRSVHRAPNYAHLREMVVSHTGLEKNCIIDFAYHIDSKSDFFPWLMGEEIFGRSIPVKNMSVTIKVPLGTELHFSEFNGLCEPEISQDSQFKIYRWSLSDIRPQINEPYHQNFATHFPRLVFSTSSDWQQIGAYLQSSLELEFPDSLVDAILADHEKILDTRLFLRNWIQNRITNIPVDYQVIGYRTALPLHVYKRGYGHSLEKANLLCQVYKKLGIKAYPCFISSHKQFSESVTSLSQFDRVGIWLENSPAFQDTKLLLFESQTQAPDIYLDGHTIFILDSLGSFHRYPKLSHVDNFCNISGQVTLDDSLSLRGIINLNVGGKINQNFTKNHLAFIQKTISDFLNVRVDSMNVLYASDRKSSFNVMFHSNNCVTFAGQSLYRWSGIGSRIQKSELGVLSKRYTPLQYYPFKENIQLTVNLPENIRIIKVPDKINVSNKLGQLIQSITSGSKIEYKREFILKEGTIQPEDYSEFVDLTLDLQSSQNQMIYFEK